VTGFFRDVHGMKRLMTLLLISLSLLFSPGCSSHIDRNKFREMKAAARAIDKAVEDATLTYEQFGAFLQKLTDEIAKTKAMVNTEEESALLSSFEELLTTYQDGSTLWEYKIDSFQYAWIPKGRIYVDERVRTIVEKYHFPTAPHVVELTGHHWESISADSLKVIWEKAHEQSKKIKTPLFL
jgi:hypothetical protein